MNHFHALAAGCLGAFLKIKFFIDRDAENKMTVLFITADQRLEDLLRIFIKNSGNMFARQIIFVDFVFPDSVADAGTVQLPQGIGFIHRIPLGH